MNSSASWAKNKLETRNLLFLLALSASVAAKNALDSYQINKSLSQNKTKNIREYCHCAIVSPPSSLPWRLAAAAGVGTTTLWRHTGHVPAYNDTSKLQVNICQSVSQSINHSINHSFIHSFNQFASTFYSLLSPTLGRFGTVCDRVSLNSRSIHNRSFWR